MFRFTWKKTQPLLCIIQKVNPTSSWYNTRNLLEGYLAQGKVQSLSNDKKVFRGTLLEGGMTGLSVYIYDCEVDIVKKRTQVTCNCPAYPFPHRAFSGTCTADELEQAALLSGKCFSCSHWREEYQHHPYGMGTAQEDISYCNLMMNDQEAWLDKCPGIAHRRKTV